MVFHQNLLSSSGNGDRVGGGHNMESATDVGMRLGHWIWKKRGKVKICYLLL